MAEETDVIDVIDTDGETVEELIEDAKGSFSLLDTIKNRAMRSAKLDLGYDEVNSDKLIAVEAAIAQLNTVLDRAAQNASDLDEYEKRVRSFKAKLKKGTPEERAELEPQLAKLEQEVADKKNLLVELKPLQDKAAEMAKEADKLRADVAAQSLSVELRALPTTIAKGATRRARKVLGISQKGIPEDREQEFADEQIAQIAYDQVVRWRDNRSGEEGTKLDIEVIRAIRDFMPLSQSAKFFATVDDLQFKNAISESVIAQSDF
ncbi:hypothetical protein [Pseudolysinimonas sp.]|uniref:hypothetical protein n=1 Tax=Pseudolysinimonas sp. TaxID=2680009 RepID=UPI003F7F8911